MLFETGLVKRKSQMKNALALPWALNLFNHLSQSRLGSLPLGSAHDLSQKPLSAKFAKPFSSTECGHQSLSPNKDVHELKVSLKPDILNGKWHFFSWSVIMQLGAEMKKKFQWKTSNKVFNYEIMTNWLLQRSFTTYIFVPLSIWRS